MPAVRVAAVFAPSGCVDDGERRQGCPAGVIAAAARVRTSSVFRYHTLRREQRLPGTPEEVFPFFADAGNLEAITPPALRFHVVTPRPIEMRAGTIIEYELRLRRIPLRWLTRIDEWEPGVRFVDEQLAGPYRLWHHTHEFSPDGAGGTVMRDVVRYALPFAPLGELVVPLVRRELAAIFDFRRDEVSGRLSSRPALATAPA